MALPDISIEYYQSDPLITHANTLIYGRLISSFEDNAMETSVRTTTAPGTATYCSIWVCNDSHVEICEGAPGVLGSRRFSMPSGERRDFYLGPQQDVTITIGYELA